MKALGEIDEEQVDMSAIAFIGLGNMGGPMAANLVKAGHRVFGVDLDAGLRESAARSGRRRPSRTASTRSLRRDVVVTMLPAGKHVLSVWSETVERGEKGRVVHRFLDD